VSLQTTIKKSCLDGISSRTMSPSPLSLRVLNAALDFAKLLPLVRPRLARLRLSRVARKLTWCSGSQYKRPSDLSLCCWQNGCIHILARSLRRGTAWEWVNTLQCPAAQSPGSKPGGLLLILRHTPLSRSTDGILGTCNILRTDS
jgi:hypothetical protein